MKKRNLKDIVKYNVYDNFGSAFRSKLDNSIYCAYSVHDGGRSVGFHQCQNKWVEEICGYKFCSRHAKEIKNSAGISKIAGTHYAAFFWGAGNYSLAEFDFSEKTEKFYYILDVRNIVGNMSLWKGKVKIDTQKNSRIMFFEHESEAWLWLYREAEKDFIDLKEQLDISLKNMNELSDFVRNEIWEKRKIHD